MKCFTCWVMIFSLVATVRVVMCGEDDHTRPLRSCKSTNDCKDDECCIRKGSLIFCKQLSKRGGKCSVEPQKGKSCHIVFCPCEPPFWCDGSEYDPVCKTSEGEE